MRHDPERARRRRSATIRAMLAGAAERVRREGGRAGHPKAQVPFEVAAGVLQGLIAVHEHVERRSEPAWR